MCNLFGPSPHNEPLVNVMLETHEGHFQFDGFVVVQYLVNGNDGDETRSYFLVECERCDDIGQEVGVQSQFVRGHCG